MYKDLCLPDKQPWQEQSPHPGSPLQLSLKTLRKCIYPFFFCLSQSLLCCSHGFTICSEAPAVSATLYLWDTDTEYPQRYSGYPGLFAGISFLFPSPPPREADELICFPSSSSDPSHLCHSGKTLAPVFTTPPPMAIIPGYFIVLSNDLAHILASGSWTFA